jgi:hemolysin activation/secretion protein
MFGPMWKSKEMEKKQQQQHQQQQSKKKTPKEQVQQRTQATDEPARLETSEEFPLAHESVIDYLSFFILSHKYTILQLFKDPELKQQRWFNLWKERRKMAFEGLEIQ